MLWYIVISRAACSEESSIEKTGGGLGVEAVKAHNQRLLQSQVTRMVDFNYDYLRNQSISGRHFGSRLCISITQA